MLTDLCQELRNWFCSAKYKGKFNIRNGQIDLNEMLTDGAIKDGQYIRIIGSTFNDGVWQYPTQILQDETFEGVVWALNIPLAVLKLSEDIDAWEKKYNNPDSPAVSPYQSESFGGYSYSKASSGSSGNMVTWKSVFADKLNRWRKIL